MADSAAETALGAPAADASGPMDPRVPLQFVLYFEVLVRAFLWSAALAGTLALAAAWPVLTPAAWRMPTDLASAWAVAWRAGLMIVIYNIFYIAVLSVLRIPIPVPRSGELDKTQRRLDPRLLYSCLLAILTKARYGAPFPAIFVAQLANVAPFRWLFALQFGPRSKTVFFVEPYILDPSGITLGRNVTVGFHSAIAAHVEQRNTVVLAPTIIEDDVLVGANVGIPGGVHIKHGAVIRAFSLLLSGCVVGENEYWAGIPARRVRVLPPLRPGETRTADDAEPPASASSDATAATDRSRNHGNT